MTLGVELGAARATHGSSAVEVTGDGLIGWVEGRSEGPLLMCVGGVHGNEPAGVRGLEEMVAKVRARRDVLAGDFVAIVGNMPALAAGRRFMAYDLNRAWTPLHVAAAAGGAPDRIGRRSRALDYAQKGPGSGAGGPGGVAGAGAAREGRGPAARPVYVLDLHTTSGKSGTFTSTEDHPRYRRFAMEVSVSAGARTRRPP